MRGKQIQRRQSVREQGGGWRGLGGEAEEKEVEEEEDTEDSDKKIRPETYKK